MRKYHKDGTLPASLETIFVFGSNKAGRHGAGAAEVAHKHFGAVYGRGHGHYGTSYAIPTKDKNIKTLDYWIVSSYIQCFVEYTKSHPEYNFFVTRIGCGLAGFKDCDIAPLFRDCGSNCSFAEEWRKHLEV